ncbi:MULTISPECIES: YqhA family protein [unclassified Devosia]|uniref:YqhA family protein n=1 Tax=unclassified Devosia TaxID=196773 RepID=UPI0015561FB8
MSEPAENKEAPKQLLDHGMGPWLMRVIGALVSRIIILPVLATMAASMALMIYGVAETWHFIRELFFADHPVSKDEALLHAIELVDLFLLATVVQVVSLGLYQLYFNQDLALPRWLKISNLDDLKSKLVGVAITVLAVYFLGRAVTWSSGPDIVYLGAATAVVIGALTYFLSKIDGHD